MNQQWIVVGVVAVVDVLLAVLLDSPASVIAIVVVTLIGLLMIGSLRRR